VARAGGNGETVEDCVIVQRQCHRFERGQVEPLGSKVNVKADDLAPLVEVDDEAIGYLARLGTRRRFELDIEAVRLRVIMKLRCASSSKLRSKNASLISMSEPSACGAMRSYFGSRSAGDL
jgi:hypothetical protein